MVFQNQKADVDNDREQLAATTRNAYAADYPTLSGLRHKIKEGACL
jgi:hypothetical protein